MNRIACPRCMPPGDPCCPYCDGTYGVEENCNMASSRMTMKQLKAVCDAYQQRAEKAESHCLALTRERDAANNEICRLRTALSCIAWPSSWANIPSSLITLDYMRHLAQDALAIGVRAANARAEAAAKCALDDAKKAKDLPECTGQRLGDKETKDGAGFQ